jgi:hypothetical protein
MDDSDKVIKKVSQFQALQIPAGRRCPACTSCACPRTCQDCKDAFGRSVYRPECAQCNLDCATTCAVCVNPGYTSVANDFWACAVCMAHFPGFTQRSRESLEKELWRLAAYNDKFGLRWRDKTAPEIIRLLQEGVLMMTTSTCHRLWPQPVQHLVIYGRAPALGSPGGFCTVPEFNQRVWPTLEGCVRARFQSLGQTWADNLTQVDWAAEAAAEAATAGAPAAATDGAAVAGAAGAATAPAATTAPAAATAQAPLANSFEALAATARQLGATARDLQTATRVHEAALQAAAPAARARPVPQAAAPAAAAVLPLFEDDHYAPFRK